MLAANLVAHWDFEETSGTVLADSTGSYDGTAMNMTGSANPGIIGNAWNFAGGPENSTTMDYVSVPNGSLTSMSVYTMSAWFKSSDNLGVLLSISDNTTGSEEVLLRLGDQGPGGLAEYMSRPGGTHLGPQSNDNMWHHIAATQDTTGWVLYVDGVAVNSDTQTTTPSSIGANTVNIGVNDDNNGGFQWVYQGLMDDMAVFDGPLTAQEISTIYQNGLNGIGVSSATTVANYDFTADAFTTEEGNAANTTNVVMLTRDDASSAETVDVVLTGTTATAGTDFTAAPVTISFAVGESTKPVPIELLGETMVEGDETLTLSLTNFSGGGQAGSTLATSVLTIENDDTSTWSLSGDTSVVEGASASYTVSLAGALGTGNEASADISLSDVDTTNADYASFVSALTSAVAAYAGDGNLTFDGTDTLTYTATNDGDMMSDLVFTLDAIDDSLIEGDEDYTVVLGSVGSVSLGGVLDPAYPSLELWLDAGTLDASTTAVSFWEDLSANSGRDASQAGAGQQPTYVASNPVFAGLPSVSFDGGDFLSSATGGTMGISGNNERTIFFVFSKQNGNQSSNILGYGANAGNQLFDVGLVSNETINGHFYGTPWLAQSSTFSLNQMTVGAVSHDGATFRTFKHDVNSMGGGSTNLSLSTSAAGNMRIGQGLYGSYNNFVGDIAEILVFSETLSAADQAAVDNYLFTKYTTGVTGSSGVGSEGGGTVTTTILSNDATLTIADSEVTEGDGGTTQLIFDVTLSDDVHGAVSVDYQILDGTAFVSDTDYTTSPTTGTLNFAGSAGEVQQIIVTVNGDTKVELDETLTVLLDNVQASGTVTVANADNFFTGGSESVFGNVPEASGYALVYDLAIPNSLNLSSTVPVPYSADNTAALDGADFSRIAYYLELDNGSGSEWVYASVDAFTSDINQIGLPHVTDNPVVFQQFVNNMNVFASANAGVTTGTGITTGNIEIWPSNYGAGNDIGVIGASSSLFDFGDGGESVGDGYSSFQVHNYGAAETLLAYNRFGGGGTSDLGIGNRPTSHPDWTFAQNANTYTIKNLQILVQPTNVSGGASATATGTVINDDSATLTISDATVVEGDVAGENRQLVFNVTLDDPVDVDVSIGFATQNGTAGDGSVGSDSDYVAKSGTTTIAAGTTATTIVIDITEDVDVEADETMQVLLNSLDANGRDAILVGSTQSSTAAGMVQFDAGDLVLQGGDVVSSWGGQSASGTPRYLSAQTPNGRPAVEFNGGGDRMGDNVPLSPSASGDWILAAVVRPNNIGAYHNLADDDASNRPMLWIDPAFNYEMNFGGGSGAKGAGTGTDGWDIVIADSRLNQLYVNSPTPNASGGGAVSFTAAETFDFFHRDGGQTFQGLVAELRVYNNRADFDSDFSKLYDELTAKWFGARTIATGTIVNDDVPNEPPQIAAQSFTSDENQTTAGTVIATDPDLPADTLTFTITGNGPDDAKFSITAAGVLTFDAATDFENPADVGGTPGDNVYLVDVQVQDSYGETDSAIITINVLPVNDNLPTFTAGASQAFSIAEESDDLTVVGNAVATDQDAPGDTLTYNITAGDPAGGFAIDSSGQIRIADAAVLDLDYDDGTDLVAVLTVNVNDGVHDVTQEVTVRVSPINDNSPIFSSANALSIAEGSTPVVTLAATDADLPAPTVTYAITGGADQSKFQIVSGNQLQFIGSPNFESPTDSGADNVYDVQVTAADAIASGISERTAAWYNLAGVMGWTEAPFGNDWVPVTAVNTNSFGVTLPYSGQVLPAGKILLHAGPPNGGKDQSVVRWTAPSDGTLTLDATFFKLHSTAVKTFVLHNGAQLDAANTGAGTYSFASGVITVAAGDTIDFIISTKDFGYGATSTGFDAGIDFTASGGSQSSFSAGADLKDNQLGPNFLSNPNGPWSYGTAATVGGTMTLFKTPTVGRTTVQNIAVTVTNVTPTTPVDSDGAANSVIEGATGSVGIDVSSTDPNGTAAGGHVTFTLSDDAGGRFQIDANTGVVSVLDASLLNFEDATSHDIIVKADDGSGAANATSTQTFTIHVTNDDPTDPADDDNDANEVAENSVTGTAVGINVSSTDPNGTAGGGDVTFTLSDDAGGRFQIDANTGEVTVANGLLLDYETETSHTITVESSDGAGGTSTKDFTINLLNVTATISGTVFVDADADGLFDGGTETAIDGVEVKLFDSALAELASDVTELGGVYAFEVDDEFATYHLREIQPIGVDDGVAILGDANGNGTTGDAFDGTVISSNEMQLTLAGIDASDYDFTEVGQAIQAGDTATIGFWQNKNGQALIKQGGSGLATWLTDNFGNVFAATFAGGDGYDVASFYKDEFFKKKLKGTSKVDAQFMATALATYFTSSNLSGGNVAASYGFHVTETGIGTKVVNVGTSGDAFGVDNQTDMTIMALLLATNGLTDNDEDGTSNNDTDGYSYVYDANGDGLLFDDELALRAMANQVYTDINEGGDI